MMIDDLIVNVGQSSQSYTLENFNRVFNEFILAIIIGSYFLILRKYFCNLLDIYLIILEI
jgi:hypothetical protein